MALASFGDEKMINKLTGKSYRETFEDILFIKENELYRLNLSYFNFPFDKEDGLVKNLLKLLEGKEILMIKLQIITKILHQRFKVLLNELI